MRPVSSSASSARQNTQPSCSSACWMYSRRQGAQSCFTRGSQPSAPAEDAEKRDPEDDHQADHDPEPFGAALARDVCVHPEDARDQREREQDHTDDSEKLEPVLLAVRDDRLVRVLERLHDLLVVVEEVVEQIARRLREELVAKLLVLLAAPEEVGDGQELDVGERDEKVPAEKDVELGRVQPLDRLVVDREVEDDEKVFGVLVDLGSLPLR